MPAHVPEEPPDSEERNDIDENDINEYRPNLPRDSSYNKIYDQT